MCRTGRQHAQACKQLALARQQYTAAIKRRRRDEGKGRIERGRRGEETPSRVGKYV